jgi:hypothetical protein
MVEERTPDRHKLLSERWTMRGGALVGRLLTKRDAADLTFETQTRPLHIGF